MTSYAVGTDVIERENRQEKTIPVLKFSPTSKYQAFGTTEAVVTNVTIAESVLVVRACMLGGDVVSQFDARRLSRSKRAKWNVSGVVLKPTDIVEKELLHTQWVQQQTKTLGHGMLITCVLYAFVLGLALTLTEAPFLAWAAWAALALFSWPVLLAFLLRQLGWTTCVQPAVATLLGMIFAPVVALFIAIVLAACWFAYSDALEFVMSTTILTLVMLIPGLIRLDSSVSLLRFSHNLRIGETINRRPPYISYVYSLLLGLCCIAYSDAFSYSNKDAYSAFNRGHSLHLESKYVEAVEAYSESIERDPTNADVWFNRAQCYWGLKKYDAAISDVNEALRLDPDNSDTLFFRQQLVTALGDFALQRGYSLHIESKYLEAVEAYSEAIELDPTRVDVWQNRSQCYWDLKKYDAAISDVNEALRLDPDNSNTLQLRDWYNANSPQMAQLAFQRGYSLHIESKYLEAAEAYSEAIELDPTDADVWHNRAQCYWDLKKYDAAISDVNEALRLNPDNSDTLQLRERWNAYSARLRLESKCLETVEACSKTIRRSPKTAPGLWYTRAQAYFELKEYDAAISDLNGLLKLNGGDSNALRLRASCFNELGDEAKAKSDLQKAGVEDVDIELAQFAFNRGYLLDIESKYLAAAEAYSESIELNPSVADAWLNRAQCYWGLQKYDAAVSDVNEALRLDPDNSDTLQLRERWNAYLVFSAYTSGWRYHAESKYLAAVAAYSESIGLYTRQQGRSLREPAGELDPTIAHVWHARAQAYVELKKFDAAISDLDEALRLVPDNSEALRLRASCFNELGDDAKARSDLEKAEQLERDQLNSESRTETQSR